MKSTLVTFFILLFSQFIVAGNGDKAADIDNVRLISGKVVDKMSGEELAGVEIKIDSKTYYTDLNGNFSVSIIPAKTEAVVSFVSYDQTKINIDPFSYTTIIVEMEPR